MKRELADDLIQGFTRAANKYHALEQTPIKTAGGITVFGSEMHLAVAIGEGAPTTATELAAKFKITKGAVSQAIRKLQAKGLVERRFRAGNEKTKFLYLTNEGRRLAQLHDRLHGVNRPLFEQLLPRYTVPRLRAISEFFRNVETLLDGLAESIRERGTASSVEEAGTT